MVTIPRRFRLGGLMVFAALIVLIVVPLHAASPPIESETTAIPPSDTVQPTTVERDQCLHCHLSGEDTGLWVPTGRWLAFGSAGIVLVVGLYQMTSTWTTRKKWRPFIARAADWVDDRYQIKAPMEKALSKPVPRHALKWFYCLGGITALLFVVQAITGILLAMYYQPTPEAAYASIQYIETQVRFGAAIRAIHHWAANGMIVMCVAHMIRVFITGAYRAPRELNWVGGTLLFIMTLAFGFTGYLLPWDQRAFWATTVGTEIAGGLPDVGPLALVFLRAGTKPLLCRSCSDPADSHRCAYGAALSDGPPSGNR